MSHQRSQTVTLFIPDDEESEEEEGEEEDTYEKVARAHA